MIGVYLSKNSKKKIFRREKRLSNKNKEPDKCCINYWLIHFLVNYVKTPILKPPSMIWNIYNKNNNKLFMMLFTG